MLLGPIFSIELITSSRRARYFWVRMLYALLLLFTLWVTYESAAVRNQVQGIQGVANVARDFFFGFAVIQLIAVLALTPAMVAGTIAQERERRTLEYLLISQLSSSDIILGKLAARLLHVVFVLLAGVPVLAAAMLLGGIPPMALLVANLATLLTLLAVGALSIAVSVWRRRTRDAVVSAYVLLFGLLVIPHLGASFQGAATRAPWQQIIDTLAGACRIMTYGNPFLTIAASASSNFRGMIGGGWRELLAVEAGYLAFTAFCLLIAVANVRRAYSKDAGRVKRLRRWSSITWRPSVGKHPMLWKEMFIESAAGRVGWLGRMVVGLMLLSVLIPLLATFFSSWPNRSGEFIRMAVVLGTLVGCFSLLIVTARAATLITSEKERDCWVSLLSTPLSAADIITAKLMGNLYAARWIALLLGLIWTMATVLDYTFVGFALMSLATWLFLAIYASCLGMAFSALLRNSTRAMAAALATGIFFGGVYLLFAFPVMAIFIANQGPFELLLALCVPYLLTFPGIFWKEDVELAGAIAYVGGLIVYTVVSGTLWSWCVATLDQRAGRMREQ